jgi:hypothetical protein
LPDFELPVQEWLSRERRSKNALCGFGQSDAIVEKDDDTVFEDVALHRNHADDIEGFPRTSIDERLGCGW